MTFFSADEDDEFLHHQSVDEAVEEYLDNHIAAEWERHIVIFEFERCALNHGDAAKLAGLALKTVLEKLDEDYANPNDNGNTSPTLAMGEAAFDFASVVAKNYNVWRHEIKQRHAVDLLLWLRENRGSYCYDVDDMRDVDDAITRFESESLA